MTNVLFNDYHDQAARNRLIELAKRHTSPREVVEKIAEGTTGQKLKRLRRIIRGEDNEVYDITSLSGEEFILRISHQDADTFAIESWAIEAVRARGVPSPNIITSGTVQHGSKILRYTVQQKLVGTTFDHLLWVEHIDPGRAQSITVKAPANCWLEFTRFLPKAGATLSGLTKPNLPP
jgi:hypothetical protein